jgi:hypothetical protein
VDPYRDLFAFDTPEEVKSGSFFAYDTPGEVVNGSKSLLLYLAPGRDRLVTFCLQSLS